MIDNEEENFKEALDEYIYLNKMNRNTSAGAELIKGLFKITQKQQRLIKALAERVKTLESKVLPDN